MNMQKTKKFEKNNIKKEYAKRYLIKYIKELKVHFDLNEDEIKEIMRKIYYTKSSIYPIIKHLSNFLRKSNEN